MERKINYIVLFFAFAPLMALRAFLVSQYEYGNIYLIIAYSFLSVLGLFLGVCYFGQFISVKKIKWLDVFFCCALIITIIADVFFYKQFV